MIRRLVFDTQYFRGLGRHVAAAVLPELQRRGFSVSVSFSAFTETWAHARRKRRPGLFFGPGRAFAPFVDPDYPIAASSADLFIRLGMTPPNPDVRRTVFEEMMLRSWKHVCTSNSGDPFYRRGGELAAEEVKDRRAVWLKLCRTWTEKGEAKVRRARSERRRAELREVNARQDEILRRAPPAKIAKAMHRYLISAHPTPGMAPPDVGERFDAYLRVMGASFLRTGGGNATAAANDAQDVLQLMHVGEPAILVSKDNGLLERLDASGSHQRAWVRTLVEVLEEPLPRGLPWGPHARRVGWRFTRRPFAELMAAEKALRARILGAANA